MNPYLILILAVLRTKRGSNQRIKGISRDPFWHGLHSKGTGGRLCVHKKSGFGKFKVPTEVLAISFPWWRFPSCPATKPSASSLRFPGDWGLQRGLVAGRLALVHRTRSPGGQLFHGVSMGVSPLEVGGTTPDFRTKQRGSWQGIIRNPCFR